MTMWEMIVWVVGLGTIAHIVPEYLKAREKGVFDEDKGNDKNYLDRIEKLEERIRVLEKIATDKSNNLKDEIDRL